MKILIIGSGGREHALAWKLSQSKKVQKIFVAPGNAGITLLEKGQNIKLTRVEDLLQFALMQSIDLTIVGSEALLVEGIVDKFEKYGLKIFGPNAKAAQLEGSKAFSKDFMRKYGIKTATYEIFEEVAPAKLYLESASYPIVIKASGLAAGKGVLICKNKKEAKEAIDSIMLQKTFGAAGDEVVIEEFLEGIEASILSMTDSHTIVPFLSAKDHKKIGEGETGLNTGGMGVVAPNPHINDGILKSFQEEILSPTLKGIKEEKMNFNGFIFFGLMITDKGIYLLEYNMRLGDPETQAILPLMKNDLLDSMLLCMDKKLNTIEWQWEKGSACCLVAAAGGYPLSYQKGKIISGIEKVNDLVFLAGVKRTKENYISSGGRVLNIVAIGNNLSQARKKAYNSLNKISFEGITFRKDIGL